MAKSSNAVRAPQFSSVLDTKSSDIDRTIRQLPMGSYVAIVEGQPRIDKSSQKQTEFSEFTMKIVEALDDVNETALDEYLTKPDGSKKKLQDCSIKARFFHTENSLYRLVNFLDHLDGLTPEEAVEVEETIKQRLAETPGKSCIIHVKHEPWQSGEGVSARVDSTGPVKE